MQDLQSISKNLYEAVGFLIEAGSRLQNIELEETKPIKQDIYHMSKGLIEILDDLQPRLKQEKLINDLYKDGIEEIEGLI